MRVISGIYAIIHIETCKCYIGSNIDVDSRLVAHKRRLRRDKHHNPKLQSAWNKYGEGSFVTHVLEEFQGTREELFTLEQKYLDKDPEYNIEKIAGIPPKSNCIPVLQFDLDGNFIAEHESMAEAGREVGKAGGDIFTVISDKFPDRYTVAGFLWALKGEKPPKFEGTTTGAKKIDQYTMEGEFIRSFKSSSEAAGELSGNRAGTVRTKISQACRGLVTCAKGFRWAFHGEELKPLGHTYFGVDQLTKEGEYIKTFPSRKEAALTMNGRPEPSNITAACNNPNRTAYGFKWRNTPPKHK